MAQRGANKWLLIICIVALAAFGGLQLPRSDLSYALLALGIGAGLLGAWQSWRCSQRWIDLGPPGSGRGFEVHAIISDVDGVLTSGHIHRISDGTAMRSFHAHDGIAHKQLVGAGIPVAWLSATSERDSILGRAAMIGLDESLVDTGEGEKGARFEKLCQTMGVEPRRVIFIGDDVNDLPAMERAGLAACPANAHQTILATADVVLESHGGSGALRELADRILSPGRA